MKGKKVSGLSIKETAADKSIEVFPNPVSDILNIDLQKATYTSLEVCDPTGRVLISEIIDNQTFTLDVLNLKNGVYFITFKGDNISYTKRFIKM